MTPNSHSGKSPPNIDEDFPSTASPKVPPSGNLPHTIGQNDTQLAGGRVQDGKRLRSGDAPVTPSSHFNERDCHQ